jgi:hypothetical protein
MKTSQKTAFFGPAYIVHCIEERAFEMVYTQQPIRKSLGNRFVEAHIDRNEQAKETELVEIGISFAVLPGLLKSHSSSGVGVAADSEGIRVQLKEREEEPVEARTFGHGSRLLEAERKCALRVV